MNCVCFPSNNLIMPQGCLMFCVCASSHVGWGSCNIHVQVGKCNQFFLYSLEAMNVKENVFVFGPNVGGKS